MYSRLGFREMLEICWKYARFVGLLCKNPSPVDRRDFDGRRLEKPSRLKTSRTPDGTGRPPVVRDP
ncbi:hypothetical protein B0H10DRAFT_2042466, partial [Mycena sp. CBHHK59/15]